MRLALVPFFAASALAFAGISIGACSGSSATIGDTSASGIDAASPTDSSPASDGASPADGSTPSDSGAPDTGKDAGVVVTEEPAPACHDLKQRAALVTAVGNAGSAPAQVPITTIAPGLYVLVSAIDYGDAAPIDPVSSSRTTVVFTATRQYYLSEDPAMAAPDVYTLDWQINNNRIKRKILCAQQAASIGTTVDYRIDAQPKGFIIYVPSTGPGTVRQQAFRYDRLE